MTEPRTFKLTIEYDGTDFHGWQIQPTCRTVQGTLLESLNPVLRDDKLVIGGASRTDAGVHALGQVAHLVTRSSMNKRKMRSAFNGVLPADVAVRSIEEVQMGWNARYQAKSKLYRYRILHRRTNAPLESRTSWFIPRPLDLPAMKAAATILVGTQDFTSFACSNRERRVVSASQRGSMAPRLGNEAMKPIPLKSKAIRTIEALALCRRGPIIEIDVRGDGFLYQMVRTIVGTLVEIGRGAIEPDAIPTIMAARDRAAAGPTAPARGLFLVRVNY